MQAEENIKLAAHGSVIITFLNKDVLFLPFHHGERRVYKDYIRQSFRRAGNKCPECRVKSNPTSIQDDFIMRNISEKQEREGWSDHSFHVYDTVRRTRASFFSIC